MHILCKPASSSLRCLCIIKPYWMSVPQTLRTWVTISRDMVGLTTSFMRNSKRWWKMGTLERCSWETPQILLHHFSALTDKDNILMDWQCGVGLFLISFYFIFFVFHCFIFLYLFHFPSFLYSHIFAFWFLRTYYLTTKIFISIWTNENMWTALWMSGMMPLATTCKTHFVITKCQGWPSETTRAPISSG